MSDHLLTLATTLRVRLQNLCEALWMPFQALRDRTEVLEP